MFVQPLTLTAFSCVPRASLLSSRIEAGELSDSGDSASTSDQDTVDVLEISPEGEAESRRLEEMQRAKQDEQSESESTEAQQNAQGRGRPAGSSEQLSEEELQVIAELQARDSEVRAHEAAHKAVGGSYAGSVSYSYQAGPDGQQYAVGGEVSISTGKAATPEATITKARQIRAAALAPADPSSQDLKVAAAASQMEQTAQMEKLAQAEQERKQEKTTTAAADNETEETSEAPSSFSVEA